MIMKKIFNIGPYLRDFKSRSAQYRNFFLLFSFWCVLSLFILGIGDFSLSPHLGLVYAKNVRSRANLYVYLIILKKKK